MNRQTWNWCERNKNVYAFDCDIDSYNFCESMNTIEQGCHGECFECLDFHYPAKRDTYNYSSWDGTVEIFHSPDPYEIPELDDIVHTNINPQRVKHECK